MTEQTMRPLIIGLPGAGKTTIAAIIAPILKMDVIASDSLFREYRAIPATSHDPAASVMISFLEQSKIRYPDQYTKLAEDASTIDAKGRCALHDSTRFRAYGEDVFRLFEIEMLKWLDRTHRLDNKIVDLSASALLYKENRDIFSIQNGYMPILFAPSNDGISKNICKDYLAYRQQSDKKPIRGAYEKAIDDAIGSTAPTSDEGKQIAYKVALEMTLKAEQKRMSIYRELAGNNIVIPNGTSSIDDIALEIVRLVTSKNGTKRGPMPFVFG